MLRAVWVLVVTIVFTVLCGVPVLTIGLLLPTRWCFDHAFLLWSRAILLASGVRLVIEGADRISTEQAYFWVGNHASALDIPVLGAVTGGRARFMAKKSLFRIPIIGWCMSWYGSTPIDRSDVRSAKGEIDAMTARLEKKPNWMIVFPEGTRIEEGTTGEFKVGAFNVCRRVGLPIVPFALEDTSRIHQARVFRIRPGEVKVGIGEIVPMADVKESSSREMAERVRKEVLRLRRSLRTSGEMCSQPGTIGGVSTP